MSLEDKNARGVVVRKYETDGRSTSVFEFTGELREKLIGSFMTQYLATGNYSAGARAVSPQGASSMAVAGAAAGATALSAAFSSTLYVATADPSSLMQLGAGLGTAVMGQSGIIGHAPFIAIPGALPVVGPILGIQALATAVIMQQFKSVDRNLQLIKKKLDDVVIRAEMTEVAQLLVASRVIEDIYVQFEAAGAFSQDMLIRLALAEKDVNSIAEKFRWLVEKHDEATLMDYDASESNRDANNALLATFLGIRISYLRVGVDLQENPKSTSRSAQALRDKLRQEIEFWEKILDRDKKFKDQMASLKSEIDDQNGVLKAFKSRQGDSLENLLKRADDAHRATLENGKFMATEFSNLVSSAKDMLHSFERMDPKELAATALVYWKDDTGEHSFAVDAQELHQIAASEDI
ncbi:hypothetical protein ACPROK_01055 [Glutamicibacter soli]|nr:hypothetical protein [Glutamicibacter soli]